jgi:hypothetical protein
MKHNRAQKDVVGMDKAVEGTRFDEFCLPLHGPPRKL